LTARIKQLRSWTVAAVTFLALAFASGCGSSDRSRVRGQVTLDEQPLEHGSITFIPRGGTQGPLSGAVITNGQYAIESANGPVPGSYKVTINSAKKTGRKLPQPPPAPPGSTMDEVVEAIPGIYNESSTLTREVKTGDNRLDFHLKSKAE
jgi:hypothetical protein